MVRRLRKIRKRFDVSSFCRLVLAMVSSCYKNTQALWCDWWSGWMPGSRGQTLIQAWFAYIHRTCGQCLFWTVGCLPKNIKTPPETRLLQSNSMRVSRSAQSNQIPSTDVRKHKETSTEYCTLKQTLENAMWALVEFSLRLLLHVGPTRCGFEQCNVGNLEFANMPVDAHGYAIITSIHVQ